MEINELNVSSSWKDKFSKIESAKPIKFGLMPKFENREVTNSIKWKLTIGFNIWAFIATFIYYAIKGMWKKSITLLVISIVVTIVIVVMKENGVSADIATSLNFLIPALSATMANYDFYRFKVLKEGNFWW